MKVTGKTTSKNSLPQLIKKLKSIDGMTAKAGFTDQKIHRPSGDTMASVAYANEIGYYTDAREFNQEAFYITMSDYKYQKGIPTKVIFGGGNMRSEMKTLSEEMAYNVQTVIDNSILYFRVTNNPTPLVDTGYMRDHIQSWVDKEK